MYAAVIEQCLSGVNDLACAALEIRCWFWLTGLRVRSRKRRYCIFAILHSSFCNLQVYSLQFTVRNSRLPSRVVVDFLAGSVSPAVYDSAPTALAIRCWRVELPGLRVCSSTSTITITIDTSTSTIRVRLRVRVRVRVRVTPAHRPAW